MFDAMSLLILPCPQTGQQSRTTTGPLRRAHL
ncbi:di-trans,poly-cis-decaprenylcistransferase, partial [Mycobacterium avium]